VSALRAGPAEARTPVGAAAYRRHHLVFFDGLGRIAAGLARCGVEAQHRVEGWRSGASDCPPEKFDALDSKALAKKFHADAVFLNPRRFWMMDHLWSYDAGETYDFDRSITCTSIRYGTHGGKVQICNMTRLCKGDLFPLRA
jgi:hypothetical protein